MNRYESCGALSKRKTGNSTVVETDTHAIRPCFQTEDRSAFAARSDYKSKPRGGVVETRHQIGMKKAKNTLFFSSAISLLLR